MSDDVAEYERRQTERGEPLYQLYGGRISDDPELKAKQIALINQYIAYRDNPGRVRCGSCDCFDKQKPCQVRAAGARFYEKQAAIAAALSSRPVQPDTERSET